MDKPESYKFCILSLSLSVSLWNALSFLPSCKYDMSPIELEIVCTDFIGKKKDIARAGIERAT